MGRLFDAVSCMLGCAETVSYEAEAAVALEALALQGSESGSRYRFAFAGQAVLEIDPAPVIAGILDDLRRGMSPADIASAFHASVSDMALDCALALAKQHLCGSIVVSGGVFQNRLLVERLFAGRRPVPLYQHVLVPPNDGGISLGQAQVAAARYEKEMN
jgi:hydrogenase maturation protein HypF